MKRTRIWSIQVVLLALVVVLVGGQVANRVPSLGTAAIAQPTPTQTTVPASPTPSPTPTASGSPAIPTLPTTPTSPPSLPTTTPLPPPPITATPLPLGGDYRDPGGRFKVGILQDYNVSPLGNSVLVEAPDGNVSYTVVLQPQALAEVTSYNSNSLNSALEQIARTVFQRGEGFQAGFAQPVAPEGIQLPWTGTLTIAGKTQAIGGVILARQAGRDALLLLIAATEAGSKQVAGAIAALTNSLQAL